MSESPDRPPSDPSSRQNGPDERQFVDRARSGDAAAFEQILDRHQERVLRVAYSMKNRLLSERSDRAGRIV